MTEGSSIPKLNARQNNLSCQQKQRIISVGKQCFCVINELFCLLSPLSMTVTKQFREFMLLKSFCEVHTPQLDHA